jgi:hypothetical protein
VREIAIQVLAGILTAWILAALSRLWSWLKRRRIKKFKKLFVLISRGSG